jgi:ferredoxin-NADP reductase
MHLVVAAREDAADGVIVLTLRDAAGSQLPSWQPGAHIDLILTPELTRQYSLCGQPDDRSRYRIGVLRESKGRGGSAYLHDNVGAGAVVHVRGPRNNFPLVPAPRYLFIGGGIGITPLIPMLAAAQAAAADWRLVYGGRSRASMAFARELQTGYPGRVTISPQDESGLLDLAAMLAHPRDDLLVYCCGPEPLLAAVEERCAAWRSGALHIERFAPRPVGEPILDGAFEVELAISGKTIAVPAGKSILEAVREAGVEVLSACSEGTCGTCETPVLQGSIDHRDSVLTPTERAAQNTMMVCVSRAACPRLVLSL